MGTTTPPLLSFWHARTASFAVIFLQHSLPVHTSTGFSRRVLFHKRKYRSATTGKRHSHVRDMANPGPFPGFGSRLR